MAVRTPTRFRDNYLYIANYILIFLLRPRARATKSVYYAIYVIPSVSKKEKILNCLQFNVNLFTGVFLQEITRGVIKVKNKCKNE